jgi:hypothetical protein
MAWEVLTIPYSSERLVDLSDRAIRPIAGRRSFRVV